MMTNPFSLEGKTILVTGASSGIGKATAIQCSKMGAKIVATGRDEERLVETMSLLEGEGHLYRIFDQTSKDSVNGMINTLPILNGCVLCAGIGMTKPLQFCSTEDFERIFKVNFFSTVDLLRLLVKKKMIKKESSCVFVSSIGGVESFNLGNGVYGTSKAAINSAMKFFAIELAPKKIRVNSVNPGMVNTKFIQLGNITEEQLNANMERYPLKRYGEPEDIAYAIIYLLSNASSWVTGQSLIIDGGLTI